MSSEIAELLLFLAVLFATEISSVEGRPPVLDWLCSLRTDQNRAQYPRNWCSEEQECTWHGVACSTDHSVVGVNLANVDLDAELADEFYAPGVGRLELSNCGLRGSLKQAIEGVTTLNLSSNKLNGALPHGFFANLLATDLSHNSLTSVGNLCQKSFVMNLDLSDNEFGDDLSECARAGAKFGGQITRLLLGNNAFTGVAPFPSCVQHYNISGNRFSDTVDPRPLCWREQPSIKQSLRTSTGKIVAPHGSQQSLVLCDLVGNNFGESGKPSWFASIADDDKDAFSKELCYLRALKQ